MSILPVVIIFERNQLKKSYQKLSSLGITEQITAHVDRVIMCVNKPKPIEIFLNNLSCEQYKSKYFFFEANDFWIKNDGGEQHHIVTFNFYCCSSPCILQQIHRDVSINYVNVHKLLHNNNNEKSILHLILK